MSEPTSTQTAFERWCRGTFLGTIALFAALSGSGREASPVSANSLPKVAQDKTALYRTHCAVCHGDKGDGNGPAAQYLYPKPRDFTHGKFRFRSTASGDVPTDKDLMAILVRGIPGSSMPSYSHLSEAERTAIIAEVKALSVRTVAGVKTCWFDKKPREIVVPATIPASTPALVERGKALYRSNGCVGCHAPDGTAIGPMVNRDLRDDWGFLTLPTDLTRRVYKGGETLQDIYLRFTTGITGTPMPTSELTVVEPQDRWALAYYIKSLERRDRPDLSVMKSYVTLKGSRVAALPAGPAAPAWDAVEGIDIPLVHLWQRTDAPDLLKIKAVHDGTSVAIRMDWNDAKLDASTSGGTEFADAAAVMFALTDPPGDFTMGGKGKPVNIWHWRMDRQADLVKFRDVEQQYPNMASDAPPAAKDTPAGERPAVVQDVNAVGFGTMDPQPKDGQNVTGEGAWALRRWKAVFVRKLASPDAKDVQLKAGAKVHVSFAVWDGASGERGGRKSVTYWQILDLAP